MQHGLIFESKEIVPAHRYVYPGNGVEENTTPTKIWCLRVAFQAILHPLPYCLTCYILSVLILPF